MKEKEEQGEDTSGRDRVSGVAQKSPTPTPKKIITEEGESSEAAVSHQLMIKEQRKVEILKFPTIQKLKAWKTETILQVHIASGRFDDSARKWVNEVLKEGATLKSLRETEQEFSRLDMKLATALWAVLPDNLKADAEHEQDQQMENATRD